MKIFFAAPFTKIINEDGLVEPQFKFWINKIVHECRSFGHKVFLAHEREEWGAKLDPPEKALKLDWDEIEESDVILAYIGNPPSPGVQMELGYASALRKPIVVFTVHNEEIPYLTKGLSAVTNIKFKEIKKPEDAAAILIKVLNKITYNS
jgi:nucleoside 2-deoxyribosyltransferase